MTLHFSDLGAVWMEESPWIGLPWKVIWLYVWMKDIKFIKIDGLGTHQSLLAEHGSIWTDKWIPAVFNVNEHWMDNKKNRHKTF